VSESAFTVLEVAGAAYLAYLAWQAFRAPAGTLEETGASSTGVGGLLLFFLAFLPQFVALEAGPVALQIVWFGLCFIVATVLTFGTVALLAGAIGNLLRRSARAQSYLNRLCGIVFAGLAVRLLTSAR